MHLSVKNIIISMEKLICEHPVLLTTHALINYMESCYNIYFVMWKFVKLFFF